MTDVDPSSFSPLSRCTIRIRTNRYMNLVETLTLILLVVTIYDSGISLSIQGISRANNSYVLTDSIGSDEYMALLCLTDKTDCCDSSLSPDGTVLGNWYSPDGNAVSSSDDYKGGSGMDTNESNIITMNSFFVSRGASVVRLHRADIISPLEQGQFYCQVPNADGVNQRVNVILCKSLVHLLCISTYLLKILLYSG